MTKRHITNKRAGCAIAFSSAAACSACTAISAASLASAKRASWTQGATLGGTGLTRALGVANLDLSKVNCNRP